MKDGTRPSLQRLNLSGRPSKRSFWNVADQLDCHMSVLASELSTLHNFSEIIYAQTNLEVAIHQLKTIELPGGKQELNETAVETAQRELLEETGVKGTES
jgi:hypothetical protein